MKIIKFILCSYYILFLVLSCKNVKKETKVEDNFYTKANSSWDAIRIPLIKPYELLKLNGSNEWNMNLQETPGSASDVKEVNVLQDIIIIHSGETYCNNEKVQEAWFTIIPGKHIEKGFQKKDDFDRCISTLQLSKPKFYNTNKVFDAFASNKKMVWQSGFK